MSRLIWSISARRSAFATGTIAAAVVSLFLIFQASPSSGDRGPEARLRAATAKYHDVNRAVADGFVPSDRCAELPGVGAMGFHYANPERLGDGVIDPYRPDILLYAKRANGRLRLTGVEWFAVDPDQNVVTDAGRPSLFGQGFDGPMPGHEPGMPIHFDFHAWVWEENPAGIFAPWNPRLKCNEKGAS